MSTSTSSYVIPFEQLRMTDVDKVGGKNASLGEMISQLAASGVRVPGGFATTATAFRDFLSHQGLDQRINAALDALNVDDVIALADTGAKIRRWVMETPLPPALEAELKAHYDRLTAESGDGATDHERRSGHARNIDESSTACREWVHTARSYPEPRGRVTHHPPRCHCHGERDNEPPVQSRSGNENRHVCAARYAARLRIHVRRLLQWSAHEIRDSVSSDEVEHDRAYDFEHAESRSQPRRNRGPYSAGDGAGEQSQR